MRPILTARARLADDSLVARASASDALRALRQLARAGVAGAALNSPEWSASRALLLSYRAECAVSKSRRQPAASAAKKPPAPRREVVEKTPPPASKKTDSAGAGSAPPAPVASTTPPVTPLTSVELLSSLRRLARTPLDATALGPRGTLNRDTRPALLSSTPNLVFVAGAEVIVDQLRIRAATAAGAAHADHPCVAESELLEGAAEAVLVDDDDELRAIQKLSVLDAALRTLRLAALPEHAAKRQSKVSGGSTRSPIAGAKKTSAPKPARAVAVERAGPADTYERKLVVACADFKGSDGRQHFKERLARNLERQGVKVSGPCACAQPALHHGFASDSSSDRLRRLSWA